jgi:hypothetical protein
MTVIGTNGGNMHSLDYKYVRFPALTAAVSGSVEEGGLTAFVIAPARSLLIAAAYEDGRLAETRTLAIAEALDYGTHSFEGLAAEGRTYRLLLVDAETYAPRCRAWTGADTSDRK